MSSLSYAIFYISLLKFQDHRYLVITLTKGLRFENNLVGWAQKFTVSSKKATARHHLSLNLKKKVNPHHAEMKVKVLIKKACICTIDNEFVYHQLTVAQFSALYNIKTHKY